MLYRNPKIPFESKATSRTLPTAVSTLLRAGWAAARGRLHAPCLFCTSARRGLWAPATIGGARQCASSWAPRLSCGRAPRIGAGLEASSPRVLWVNLHAVWDRAEVPVPRLGVSLRTLGTPPEPCLEAAASPGQDGAGAHAPQLRVNPTLPWQGAHRSVSQLCGDTTGGSLCPPGVPRASPPRAAARRGPAGRSFLRPPLSACKRRQKTWLGPAGPLWGPSPELIKAPSPALCCGALSLFPVSSRGGPRAREPGSLRRAVPGWE